MVIIVLAVRSARSVNRGFRFQIKIMFISGMGFCAGAYDLFVTGA